MLPNSQKCTVQDQDHTNSEWEPELEFKASASRPGLLTLHVGSGSYSSPLISSYLIRRVIQVQTVFLTIIIGAGSLWSPNLCVCISSLKLSKSVEIDLGPCL